MKIKKWILSLLTGFGSMVLVWGLYAFTENSGKYEAYEPLPPWENLKVLPQDISKDSLIGLMKNYSAALGVKCNFCHVPKKDDPKKLDFPVDEKIEKEIARGMIKMTNDLNELYFKPHFPDPKPKQVHVVNCVLCHRGTADPEKYLSEMGLMYRLAKPEEDHKP